MPGILASFRFSSSPAINKSHEASLDRMMHFPWYKRINIEKDADALISKIDLPSSGAATFVHRKNGRMLLLDGDIFEWRNEKVESADIAGVLESLNSSLANGRPLYEVARELNGVYNLIAYDRDKSTVTILSDRHGLRPLYVRFGADEVSICSEVKGLLSSQRMFTLNHSALLSFLDFGYFLNQSTHFQEIKNFPAATEMTIDLATGKSSSLTYWEWPKLKDVDLDLKSMNCLIDDVGQAICRSVKVRVRQSDAVGLTLSGGLDSRAIFAATKENKIDVQLSTFGVPACRDIQIARQVSQVYPDTRHSIFHISGENWLDHRRDALVWTDGLSNFLHFHGIAGLFEKRDELSVNLDGYLGDAILGGSYLGDRRFSFSEKILNRGRRFILTGQVMRSFLTPARFPFLDYRLIDLVCQVPIGQLRNSKFYNRVLLAHFPSVFSEIPWAKTGSPIGGGSLAAGLSQKMRSFFVRAHNKVFPFRPVFNQSYVNYPLWLSEGRGKELVESTLLNSALLSKHFPRQWDGWVSQIRGLLRRRSNHSETTGNLLTLELWFRYLESIEVNVI